MRTSDRFHAKYVVDESGCWLWRASITPAGYGHFWGGVRMQMAHRYAYEMLVGPIPEGLDLDHTCHNADTSCSGGPSCPHRRCVNPAHLEPVTRSENLRRGRTGKLPANHAHQTSKTHCIRGHEFDADNTYEHGGTRHCKACRRVALRAWRERQREAA